MKRMYGVALLVLLARPAAAQVPTCTSSKTTRVVAKGTQWVNGVLKTWYVSSDSVAGSCAKFPAVHDTVTRVDTVRVVVHDTVTPAPPVPVDTTPTPPPAPLGSNTPNRPASYTKIVTDYAFTSAPPSSSADIVNFDGSGWSMIGGGPSAVRKVADPSAPNADKSVWEQIYPPGSGGGNAAGIIYYENATTFRPLKLYASVWVWYSPGFEWNQISQKFLYWEDGNLLLQQNHNTNNPLSMYIGAPGYDVVYDHNKCAMPPLSAFEGKWHLVEWQVERGSPGLLRVWLDGTLCSDYKVNVPSLGGWSQFNINSTWGGGGTRTRTSYRRLDHVFVATVP